MKKLMKAVTAAAVTLVASGAFADLPSPTEGALGFEALDAGKYTVSQFVTMTDGGESTGSKYWYAITNASQDASAELATIVDGGTPRGNYLSIEAQAPLYRTINDSSSSGGYGAALNATAEAIPASGIYLDTMVKFTVSSDEFKDGDLDTADKLAITCYSADDSGVTNIIVRAGYVGSSVVATNYVMGLPSDFDVDAWHRLTVRAIADVGSSTAPVGFAVYLDQTLLEYGTNVAAGNDTYVNALDGAVTQNLYNSETHALLPSLVTTGDYKNTLTAVGFKGTGSLDDIQFTNEKPSFIVEEVVATFTADAGVTAITVTVDQTDYTVDMTALTVSLPAGTTTFTVTATIDSANGYSLASLNGGISNPATVSDYDGSTIAISTTRNNFSLFDENGDPISGTFATLAQAMSATGVAKIQLAYDYTVADWETITPNKAVYTVAGDFVLDLNGKTLDGGSSESDELFNVTGTMTVIDSIGGGKIVYGGTYGMFDNSGDLAIGAADGDQGVTIDGVLFVTGDEGDLIRANVKADGNTTDTAFTWANTVKAGSSCSAAPAEGYWVVAPGSTPAVTWASLLGAAVNGAYEIDNLAELKKFQTNVGTLETAGETFKLTADIALDAAWEGIGIKGGKDLVNGNTKDIPTYEAGAFCGTFDGQNHTISNFQMESATDYGGFFNSVNGATISNLKISYKENKLCADSSSTGGDTGATFVGVARNSTLQNLTALATESVTTVSASKDMAGIVGYLMAGSTVDSCTNELNVASLLTAKARKSGGIALITQDGTGTATIRNCKNNGTVTLANAGGQAGGIVGYVGNNTTIIDCENAAAVKVLTVMGSAALTMQGTNKGNATVLSSNVATNGLNFATVDGTVATFVADDALALNGSYKVMATGATATFAFAEAGTIAFDTALATPTFAITAAEGLTLTDATAGTVKTYTATADEDWTDDPITPGTSAATQYPALADTALATADAGKLTEWATENNVEFSSVKTAAGDYVEAFLLNCAPANVETAKANFKATITVNADGTVTVTAPGDYNVTPTIQGKQTLSDAEWHTKTDGDKFFRAVLSL